MDEGFVEKIIRRSNLVLMIAAVLGVMGVLVAAALQSRYLYNFVKGPFPLSQTELLAIDDPSERLQYFVTISSDEVEDTGYQYVTTLENDAERVESYYFALGVGDRWLLVRTTSSETRHQYSGALVPMPADEQAQIIGDIETQVPELKGVFLPMLLDTQDFRKGGYLGVGAGILVFILSVFLALLSLKRSNDPTSHPIMKALSRYGNPETVAAQIDSEMGPGAVRIGSAFLTSSWFIHSGWFHLKAMRIQDVVWLYKRVVQHRTNGIPSGKSYYAVILDQQGKVISIASRQNRVDEILQALGTRAPWSVKGYNSELEALWRKDRVGFLNEVNRRKTSSSSM